MNLSARDYFTPFTKKSWRLQNKAVGAMLLFLVLILVLNFDFLRPVSSEPK
jgi:hypothetical protein